MFVPFHGDGIISQFEGYEALGELDWDGYREKYGNIQRLDRILRAEGDDPNRYKIAKQADAVMLFFLFSPNALRRLFERLGYEYRADTAARNIAYYDQRTSHGSTLSLITYAGVLADLDPASSWQRFLEALDSDLGDVQGGTTKEGISGIRPAIPGGLISAGNASQFSDGGGACVLVDEKYAELTSFGYRGVQVPYDAFAAGLGDYKIVTTLCPGGKERMRRLMSMVQSKRFDPLPLLTHRFKLDQIVEAYTVFGSRRDGCLKVAITP